MQQPKPTAASICRLEVRGKFLFLGNHKFYIKGTTYGTFAPDSSGIQFPEKNIVRKDFAMMSEHGFNAIRTYTVPPKYLLDLAMEFDLKVMVGLPWEQHVTFLDSAATTHDIIRRVQQSVESMGQHPAILCYTIGNEIPATIVRWYGKKKIEDFLKQLFRTVKNADPESLVTYVNYPTTEYLDLSFMDFFCFNVYLESPEKLSAYISRLHNLSGDKPLVLAEIGLDSLRNGEIKQAEVLKWQVQTIFGKGCAGMFVFAWTDEWWRGGFEIDDWNFGLVDRERKPKLALPTVAEIMHAIPFQSEALPFISVVVCSYNGSATIRDTLDGLQKLDYPHFEVIVVNDGSTDQLADIVREYPVRLITTPNRGLSNARNTGLYAARGEIIAYIDDDAYPDPHWLHYLAYGYMNSNHAGLGGPNICPEEDGPIAKCVANSPGGPVHVLMTNEIAEHIPGCNMSFRKDALLEVGGCDPIYRAAGDDVDLCWRIQATGRTIGFHPGALVWHHRRNSVKAYWKQQKGYGKAEALLEGKWPEKYNGLGHLAWAGRIYGNGLTLPIRFRKDRIFHGTWGTALFQSIYQPAEGFFSTLPLMPEWYLLAIFLAGTASLGFLWAPLFWVWPLFIASVLVMVIQAVISAARNASLQGKKDWKYTLIITFLHLIQPIARLCGRLNHGLTPWRKRGDVFNSRFLFAFRRRVFTHWSEEWRSASDWLRDIESKLISLQTRVRRSGDFDNWDVQARNGLFSITRALLAIEEHGAGKQYLRLRVWVRPSKMFTCLLLIFLSISIIAALDHAVIVSFIFACFSTAILAEYLKGASSALFNLQKAFSSLDPCKREAPVIKMKETVTPNDQPESIYLHPELIGRKVIVKSEPPNTILN